MRDSPTSRVDEHEAPSTGRPPPFAARVVLGARAWETKHPRATACARE